MSNITSSLTLIVNGGPGSGNFGHAGRPGLVGGSAGKGGKGGSAKAEKSKSSKGDGKVVAKKRVLDIIKKGGSVIFEGEYHDRAIIDGVSRLAFQLSEGDSGKLSETFMKSEIGKLHDEYDIDPGVTAKDVSDNINGGSLYTEKRGKSTKISDKEIEARRKDAHKTIDKYKEWEDPDIPKDEGQAYKEISEFWHEAVDLYYDTALKLEK